MTLSAVQSRISFMAPHLAHVQSVVKDKLAAHCEPNGFPYVGRLKTAASIAEKIETGRFARFSELDDLVAFAVVIPSYDSEDLVLDYLKSQFVEVVTRGRGSTSKSPDVFRFDATRFIATLMPRAGADPDSNSIYSIKFEIQIRTAFEHAWSVATHASVYKPNQVDWRRLRLAAQLKAAVEQLDSLVVAFDELAPHLKVSNWPDIEAKSRVADLAMRLRDGGGVNSISFPESIGRFSDNFVSLAKSAKSRNESIADYVDRAIQAIEGHVRGGNSCPLSFSLYQWCVGILADADMLTSIAKEFPLPINEDLAREFVKVAALPKRFSWVD